MTPVTVPHLIPDPSDPPPGQPIPDELVTIAAQRDRGHVLLQVCGELDVAGAPRLHRILQGCAERGEHITVDLRNVRFVDCSGLRPLVTAAALAERQGRCFTVAAVSAPVRRVLELTRLTRLLDGGAKP